MRHVEKDLFGHPLAAHAPAKVRRGVRKVGYAARLATGPKKQRCGTCIHAARVLHRGNATHKCQLMAHAWTHGEETDISLRAPACWKWDRKPFDKKEAA